MTEQLSDVGAKAPLARLGAGLGFFFSGVKMCFTRADLLGISIITIALNFVIYLALLGVAYFYTSDVLDFVGLEAEWARWLVGGLIVIGWLIVCIFLAIFIANIVAGPLLDMISEKTEQHITGEVNAPKFSLAVFFSELMVILKVMLVSVLVSIISLALSFIPLVGPFISFAIGAGFVGLNFIHPPAARHGLTAGERLDLLKNNRLLFLGFGAVASLPFVSFILVPLFTPALVVGGTRMFLSLAAHGRAPSRIDESRLVALRS
jgi:CysZ protein